MTREPYEAWDRPALCMVLHEMGRALSDDAYLDVIGREEDAADAYATTAMLRIGDAFSQRVLEESAKGWFYSAKPDRAKRYQRISRSG